MTIRVLVADDQALFREALTTLLEVQQGIEVVGEAANGEEAVLRSSLLRPDVVLMDLRMPVLDGIAATARLRTEQPDVRVLALTTFDDDEDVFAALRAGAVGYLLKDVTSARLVEALDAADRGESVLQPSVAAKVIARVARSSGCPPWAVGFVSGSMILSCSNTDPGQPWVMITGRAFGCFERTWMK